MHGALDRTVSEPQGLTFFTALKDRGVPARYIRFPREAHGLREPRHQRLREIEEIQWIQKYTMGIDWKSWPVPAPVYEN
jgi:dipeptidyl aminopeptidase/acylaminoacyl peptidase